MGHPVLGRFPSLSDSVDVCTSRVCLPLSYIAQCSVVVFVYFTPHPHPLPHPRPPPSSPHSDCRCTSASRFSLRILRPFFSCHFPLRFCIAIVSSAVAVAQLTLTVARNHVCVQPQMYVSVYSSPLAVGRSKLYCIPRTIRHTGLARRRWSRSCVRHACRQSRQTFKNKLQAFWIQDQTLFIATPEQV